MCLCIVATEQKTLLHLVHLVLACSCLRCNAIAAFENMLMHASIGQMRRIRLFVLCVAFSSPFFSADRLAMVFRARTVSASVSVFVASSQGVFVDI
jgi:hypothetical protein